MWQLLMDNNWLHSKLKDFERNNPKQFVKTDIKRCGHCNATGLKQNDPHTACKDCVGIGYIGQQGFTELIGEVICPDCNSTGKDVSDIRVRDCKICGGTGHLDWIEAIKQGLPIEGLL